jgi:predicted DNA binding protein/putative methionine-R-sulfoxide reductase with GAF domain
VDDTPGVLAVDAGAVYLFDADDNELRPAAHTGAMTELHGPLVPVPADGETLPSHSFLADETLCFDNVHEADLLETPVTDLRSASYIPLGNHGVFVAGSTEVGRFDDVTRELADLLAATAEAALDRVSREAKLRNQDRQLQQRNEELSVLNRINETIRDIDQAIVRAETHQEVDRAVCERLTDDERFRFAWVGAVDPMTETVEPRTWAGAEQGYLDSQSFQVAESATEPAGRTAATGEVAHVTDVAAELRDEDWRTDALRREFASVLSIPLVYNDLTHGVLTVYADTPEAFDETARSVLAELGETIAAALSAIERKNALLTTSMRRVEFGIDDPTFLLTRLARRAECTVRYEGGIQQSTGRSDIFVTVDDRTGDAVTDVAAELAAVAKVHRITADDDQSVLRLGLTRPFLAQELADHGAIFREATADPASTTFVVDVPESIAVRKITAFVRETFPDADLHSKRTLDGAVEWDLRSSYLEKLTDRQIEVVQTAYYSGYFESPRASNGEDVAETLDISPPAFYEHVRAVQRKLLATVFEEHGTTITPSS